MRVILQHEQTTEVSKELSQPEYHKLKLDYGEGLKIETTFGTILTQKFVAPDFELGYQHLFSKEPASVLIKFDEPMLMLSFLMDGEVAYLKEGETGATAVRNGSYHLCYESIGEHPLHLGKGYVENFFIVFAESYLEKISGTNPQIDELLNAINNKQEHPLHSPFYKITARIRKVIREIIAYKGDHAFLFVQTRINDLLLLFLDSVSNKDFPEPVFTTDKEKLTALSEFILASLDKHINAETLARQFGYSINVLHKKFKRTYGISLYKYIQDQRMLKARSLLTGGIYYNVGTIALMCGYDDASNFCAAFRRRFGHSTSYYRMAGRTLR